MNTEYKPFSLYHHFELIHHCFNRDCAIETITFFDFDLLKHCKICNNKLNQSYQMQTFYNKNHLGLEDWENYRGFKIIKTCNICQNIEKKSYTYSSLQIGKSCAECGSVSPLIYIKFVDMVFKMFLPVIKYGRFECEPCKNIWITYFIFWGCKHQCKKCLKLHYPIDVSAEFFNPINFQEYQIPQLDNIEKNHMSKYCEKCVVKGEPCYLMSIEEVQEIAKKLQTVKKKYLEPIIQLNEIKKKEIYNLIKQNDLYYKKESLELELEKEKVIDTKVLLK